MNHDRALMLLAWLIGLVSLGTMCAAGSAWWLAAVVGAGVAGWLEMVRVSEKRRKKK